MQSDELRQSIVRILRTGQTSSREKTVGTGFIISTSNPQPSLRIVTCAHVVSYARGKPGSEIEVALAVNDERFNAYVEPDCWRDAEQEDIAILKVPESFEAVVQRLHIAPLKLGTSRHTEGHEFLSWGFPSGVPGGIAIEGRITSERDRTQLQLESDAVVEGVSGAPVFDRKSRRVVGVISERTHPDLMTKKQTFKSGGKSSSLEAPVPTGRLGDIAFAVPSQVLVEICSILTLDDICPYRGLLPFEEEHAPFFCGQDEVIDELVSSLRQNPRFLAVIGASGSGKSSLIRAGLLPRLRNDQGVAAQFGEIITCRLGDHPHQALMGAIQRVVPDIQAVPQSETSAWETSWAALKHALHHREKRLVLVIDQFEELFALCSEEVQTRFIAGLSNVLQADGAITLIITLRADFFDPLLTSDLGGCLKTGRVDVRPMSEQNLRKAVEQPADRVGLTLDEGLVDLILIDLGATPQAPLPLLEFTLEQLWQEEHLNNRLSIKGYKSLGRVTGAIAQWADKAYYNLAQPDQPLAQKLLLHLIRLNEQGGLPTRRRMPIQPFVASVEPAPVRCVIDTWVKQRLLITARVAEEETVEIIHEALIREWGLLQDWLTTHAEGLTQKHKLETVAKDWLAHQKEPSYLLTGDRLTRAEQLLDRSQHPTSVLWLDPTARDLVQASRRQRRLHHMQVGAIATGVVTAIGLTGSAGMLYWQQLQRSPALEAAQQLRQHPKQLTFAEDSLHTARNFAESGEIDNAMAAYRTAITFAFPGYVRDNDTAGELVSTAETELLTLIENYGLMELDALLQELPQSRDKAIALSRDILFNEVGVGADLNSDALIENVNEAERMPCDLLKKIQTLWLQHTGDRCDWAEQQDANFVSGYEDNDCNELGNRTLAFQIFEGEYFKAPGDRLYQCGVIPAPIN